MRRTLLAGIAVVAVLAAPAATSAPPIARLLARPPATAGAVWSGRLAVRPATAVPVPPAVLARRGGSVRRASLSRLARGLYRVRLVFPTAGTWRLEARLPGRLVRLGSVVARARPPVTTLLDTPAHAALGPDGALLVVEDGRHRVLRVDPATGRASVLAGTGTILHSGDGGPARAAGLGSPFGLSVAPDGEVFVTSGERLRRIDRAGRISTAFVAPADLGPLAADARSVFFVAADARIYRYDRASAAAEHYAGTGATGFAGDGGPAALATFSAPHGLAFDGDGALLVTDTGNDRVRRIDPVTRVVTTVAAGVTGSWGIARAEDGALYVGAWTANRIYRLEPGGGLVPVAGNGSLDSSGDGGPATAAGLPGPVGMAADARSLYVVESRAGRIRRIDRATGTITTLRLR
jgi:DNA-binding beta-propeller fold protein YncE